MKEEDFIQDVKFFVNFPRTQYRSTSNASFASESFVCSRDLSSSNRESNSAYRIIMRKYKEQSRVFLYEIFTFYSGVRSDILCLSDKKRSL